MIIHSQSLKSARISLTRCQTNQPSRDGFISSNAMHTLHEAKKNIDRGDEISIVYVTWDSRKKKRTVRNDTSVQMNSVKWRLDLI